VSTSALALSPRDNTVPTLTVAIARGSQGRRQLGPMRLGLIPSWARHAAIGTRMAGARAETVREAGG
jgi:putative SOS response-associated peptidase YedK